MRKCFLLFGLMILPGCSVGIPGEPPANADCRTKAHYSALRQVTEDERDGDRGVAGADDLRQREIEERETALCREQGGR